MKRPAVAILASVLLLAPGAPRAQTAAAPAADQACPAGNIDLGSLPRSTEAIAKAGEFTVVAFGSSATPTRP